MTDTTADPVTIRRANAADADLIASIHARSWASAYRGIFSDTFLDGPVHLERQTAWRARYADPGELVALIAEQRGQALGFIAWVPRHDPVWGGFIDNLHMLPDAKGRGIGRRLLTEIFDISRRLCPGIGFYLFVLAGNRDAQQAYDRLGGRPVETLEKASSDGATHPSIRYAWPAPVAND